MAPEGTASNAAERLTIPLAELPDGALTSRLLANGRKAVIVRRGDDVRVFGDTCPHMGAELSQARFCARTGTVHCRWHGYVFGVDDGRFVENPNVRPFQPCRTASPHFRPDKSPQLRLPTLAHRVEGGVLILEATRVPAPSAAPEPRTVSS